MFIVYYNTNSAPYTMIAVDINGTQLLPCLPRDMIEADIMKTLLQKDAEGERMYPDPDAEVMVIHQDKILFSFFPKLDK